MKYWENRRLRYSKITQKFHIKYHKVFSCEVHMKIEKWLHVGQSGLQDGHHHFGRFRSYIQYAILDVRLWSTNAVLRNSSS